MDNTTDAEISERLRSLGEQVARIYHGGVGNTIRFLATTGVQFVPLVGPAASIALDALDTFVVDKLIPEPGPIAFLGSTYTSIFKPADPEGTNRFGGSDHPSPSPAANVEHGRAFPQTRVSGKRPGDLAEEVDPSRVVRRGKLVEQRLHAQLLIHDMAIIPRSAAASTLDWASVGKRTLTGRVCLT